MIPIVTPVILNQRECPQCGHKVGGGYVACPQCGASLPNPARANQIVILGLVLALIGGVVMFLRYV